MRGLPISLMFALTLAYRYWAKGGTKRRATPNMDLSWRSQAPGD